MQLTFWNINESMNPFVSNFLWAGGMAGSLGWCNTSNLVSLSFHNQYHACLCVFHSSSLACTSYSPITSLPRTKKTRPFLLSSSFLYLERKVRGWKTYRNGFLGGLLFSLFSVSGSREADGSLKPSFKAMAMIFGKETMVNVNQEEKQFELKWHSSYLLM